MMSQANVTQLHTYRGIRDAEAAMTIVRTAMHSFHYAELAESVNVSVSCILAVRSGRTKWPRSHTFFGLLRVLNLEMQIKQRDAK
jgi:hypothetical protein